MKKRSLALGLCLALCLSAAPTSLAFTDVADPAAAEAVEVLSGLGLVSGYPDGGYHPGDTLTRAQFCKLAVLAEGHEDRVKTSAYRTLFSDVPGSDWAAPYVNLAYEEKLVSGYGNGTFGPDDPVTVAQAVTIVLRLLGYGTADVGPFWPEDYMSRAVELELLDGLEVEADDPLTRGGAAVLLYQLLQADDAQGRAFYENLCASTVENVLLMDTDAAAEDGTLHTAQVFTGEGVRWYVQESGLSGTLEGTRGTLLLDKNGSAVGFLPDGRLVKTITAAAITAASVTDTEGNTYTLNSAMPVLLDDERQTYSDCWYDLRKGDTVTFCYNAAGSIDLVWVADRAEIAGTVLTGYYENAVPNASLPSTIQLLGVTLAVADEGRAALSAFSVGDRISITLNGAGEVVSASAAVSGASSMVGVLTSAGASRLEVELLCGITVSGEPGGTPPTDLVGALVRVNGGADGIISVSALTDTGSTRDLNVSAGTLGELALSADVRIFDRAGTVAEVTLEELPAGSIPAASIAYVGLDTAGQVNLLVLDDVTGNCYTYGILEKGTVTSGSGTQTAVNQGVTVKNSRGSTSYIYTGAVSNDAVGGVAGAADGRAGQVVTLTSITGLTRADFDGVDTLAGIPISGDVQVYNTVTGQWTGLTEAKGFSGSFTAWYDRTPEAGGRIRVIFAE